MNEPAFNPLYKGKSKQSTEAAPDPAPAKEFDTTTPVRVNIRRFTLNDLPRYQASLYPHLKEIFPHLHERMYGGWLQSTMQDNTAFLVCGDATVALAKMINDPLDPRPVVQIVFCLGDPKEFNGMYAEMLRWAKDIGAREARAWGDCRDQARALKILDTVKVTQMTMFYLD